MIGRYEGYLYGIRSAIFSRRILSALLDFGLVQRAANDAPRNICQQGTFVFHVSAGEEPH